MFLPHPAYRRALPCEERAWRKICMHTSTPLKIGEGTGVRLSLRPLHSITTGDLNV